jgi:hypothetical protein
MGQRKMAEQLRAIKPNPEPVSRYKASSVYLKCTGFEWCGSIRGHAAR